MLLVGVLQSASGIIGILFAFPFGWLSDAKGRTPFLFAGCVLLIVASIILSIMYGFFGLLTTHLVLGLAYALFWPSLFALILDNLKRAISIGIMVAVYFIGPLLASPIVGYIIDFGGFRTLF